MSKAVNFNTMSLDELREDLEKNKAILEKAAVEQGITPENIEEKLETEHQRLSKDVAAVQKKALEAAFKGDADATAKCLQEMRSLTENSWALAYTKYNKGVSALNERTSARLSMLSAAPALLNELDEKYKKYREIVLAGEKTNGITDENLQAKFKEEMERLQKCNKEEIESSWATALGQITKIRKVEDAFQTIIEYYGDTSK